jgi:hypothetical protein
MIQILLICYGVYAIISGRFQLIPGKTVRGGHARWAGAVLVLTPVVALLVGIVIVANIERTSATPLSDLQRFQGQAIILDIVFMLASVIIAALIASSAPPESVFDTGNKKNKQQKHPGSNNPYSVDEIAALLHTTPDAVLKLIQEKKLPARWINGTYQVDRVIFERYFAHHRRQGASVPSYDSPLTRDPIDMLTASVTPAYPTYTPDPPPVTPAPTAPAAPNERVRVLNEQLAQNPNDVTALFNRGRAWFNAGMTELAVMDFARVLELQPNHPNAASMRGFIAQYGLRGQVSGYGSGEQLRT